MREAQKGIGTQVNFANNPTNFSIESLKAYARRAIKILIGREKRQVPLHEDAKKLLGGMVAT